MSMLYPEYSAYCILCREDRQLAVGKQPSQGIMEKVQTTILCSLYSTILTSLSKRIKDALFLMSDAFMTIVGVNHCTDRQIEDRFTSRS
jgi:hypothetical protein